MFFKRILQDNTRPVVKDVSHFINNKSHKQKKYISLMVVPSYSTGKTRSIRVPRSLFYGVISCMLFISAAFTGLYLRSNYHQREALYLESSLLEIGEYLYGFRADAYQTQNNLIDAVMEINAELSQRDYLAQLELDQQARIHQIEVDVIWGEIRRQIEEIERTIVEFDEDRQAIIDGLSGRAAIIPPVAALMIQLEESQTQIRELSLIHSPQFQPEESGIGLMAMGSVSSHTTPLTPSTVNVYLRLLVGELEVQRKLMESLEYYRTRMDVYLRNFPTLWPIRGEISSNFGWRSNPFGGGSQHHDGIDIRAATGTPIRATGGGTVTFSGWRNGYGHTVTINHGNGITTMYAHNSRNLVRVGQRVERGEIIAHVGSTGLATGPHVHYEVIVNGRPVNPITFMREHY